jgi:hypothetical protein
MEYFSVIVYNLVRTCRKTTYGGGDNVADSKEDYEILMIRNRVYSATEREILKDLMKTIIAEQECSFD